MPVQVNEPPPPVRGGMVPKAPSHPPPLKPPPRAVEPEQEPAADDDSRVEWHNGKRHWDDNCFCKPCYCQQLLLHVLCFKPVQEVWYPSRGLVFTDGKFIRAKDIYDYRASLGFEASAFNLPSWCPKLDRYLLCFSTACKASYHKALPPEAGRAGSEDAKADTSAPGCLVIFSNGNNMIVETICTWGCSTFGFVEYHLGSYS